MPRLFTGIEIPPLARDHLALLKGGLPGARWIDPQNYHLTLRFVGDIDGRTASEIAAILDKVRRRPFDLRIDGIGSLGSRRPHSIVATIAPSRELTELQAEQERLMQKLGLPPEQRKYTPHVTLARIRGVSERQIADYLSLRGGLLIPPFSVDRFVLFSSRDSVGGGPYIVEEAYPLVAKAA